ncbi:MAG: biotin-dependent carboxyltransferase family protein [Thermodesulfobacteriota bacterium]
MEVFAILEPGAFTTVQDGGRYGYQQFGIPVSGALDMYSYLAANVLVGNSDNAAVLEITFTGPKMEVLSDAIVAVTGADIPILVNDASHPTWTSFEVHRGDVLSVRAARKGVRAYLAVDGGISVPVIMGSRSTYTAGKIGGYSGRALAKGDRLHAELGSGGRRLVSFPEELKPSLPNEIILRALPGPQDDYFESGLEAFFNSEFTVSSKADRMGYRLEGPSIELKEGAPRSIISEPSLSGAVQIPADGHPIILLVEQTAGGYAKIATVVTPDLNLVAQAKPGNRIRFKRVDVAEIHRLYVDYRSLLEHIKRMF